MSSTLTIPSQGFWYAAVRAAGKTLIRPGATMRLGTIVRAEGPSSIAPEYSRLVLECGDEPASDDGSQRATVAVLKAIDTVSTHIMLYQGQTYAFEVIGEGATMHIEGKFEPLLPNNHPIEDTVILQVEATD